MPEPFCRAHRGFQDDCDGCCDDEFEELDEFDRTAALVLTAGVVGILAVSFGWVLFIMWGLR